MQAMQSIQDITERELNTLILIRSMKEFITDEYDNLSSLNNVVWSFEESLSAEEHMQYVEDICKLTASGYLISDATENHIKEDKVPDVEGISLKGESLLKKWEEETRETVSSGKTVIINLNFNFSLIEISSDILDTVGSIFKFIGGKFKNEK